MMQGEEAIGCYEFGDQDTGDSATKDVGASNTPRENCSKSKRSNQPGAIQIGVGGGGGGGGGAPLAGGRRWQCRRACSRQDRRAVQCCDSSAR